MKTLLYTGHDTTYKPLADITVPRMQSYALKRDMDFMCFTEPLIDVPNGIYWTGVCGALKAFEEGYERAIYLDVDQLVTNFDASPPDGTGFHVSKDWGDDASEPWHFSMCGFVAYRNSAIMLERVLSLEPEWRGKPFIEQGPMQHVAKNIMANAKEAESYFKEQAKYYVPTLISMFTICPRKVFNCVPDQVCPGKVPEPWQPGDFAAHITMVDLPRRIEIAKEILASL